MENNFENVNANENKIEKKCSGFHFPLPKIAIILSIISIVFSSFSLGFSLSNGSHKGDHDRKEYRMTMQNMPNMPSSQRFNGFNGFNDSNRNDDNNADNRKNNSDRKSDFENFTPNFKNRPAKESKGPENNNNK